MAHIIYLGPRYAKRIFSLTDALQILALVLSFGCGVTFTKLDDRWKIFVFSCLGIWICAYIMLKILLACHPEPGKTSKLVKKRFLTKFRMGRTDFSGIKNFIIGGVT